MKILQFGQGAILTHGVEAKHDAKSNRSTKEVFFFASDLKTLQYLIQYAEFKTQKASKDTKDFKVGCAWSNRG